MSDSLTNLISQFNQAINSRKEFFICRTSKKNIAILKLLLNQGLILGFYKYNNSFFNLCVFLKYNNKQAFIKKLSLISKQGCKVFVKKKNVLGDFQSSCFFIISTSVGGLFFTSLKSLMLNKNSLYAGGEYLLKVVI